MSDKIIPDDCIVLLSLVNILSINVAVASVIIVGKVIDGLNPKLNILSKKSELSLILSKSILKSTRINMLDFEIFKPDVVIFI